MKEKTKVLCATTNELIIKEIIKYNNKGYMTYSGIVSIVETGEYEPTYYQVMIKID